MEEFDRQHAEHERGNAYNPSSGNLQAGPTLTVGGQEEGDAFLPAGLQGPLMSDGHIVSESPSPRLPNPALSPASVMTEAPVSPNCTAQSHPDVVQQRHVQQLFRGQSQQQGHEQFKHKLHMEDQNGCPWLETDHDRPSLMAEQVPIEMRESYIHTGYRPPGLGVTVSAYSALYLHNETLNFWTHMIPFLYFAYFLFIDQGPWLRLSLITGLGLYPFYGYMFGICTLFGASSFAHLFHCAGQRRWRNVCFVMDYAAISVYGMASAIAYYFYSRPRFRGTFIGYILSGEGHFLGFTTATAWVATYASCVTRLRPTKYCYAIRTVAFALPFITGSFPAIMRWLHAGAILEGPPAVVVNDTTVLNSGNINLGTDTTTNMTPSVIMDIGLYRYPQLDYDFQTPYTRHLVMLAGGALINVIKIPERFWPGMFDTIGSSHQWFHILVFLSIREQFWLMLEEIACHSGMLYARDPDNSMPWGRATIKPSQSDPMACTILTSTSSLPGPAMTTSWFYPWGWSWNSLLFCALGNPRSNLDTWMALNTIAWMTILLSVLTITIVWFGYSYNFTFSPSWCTTGHSDSDSAHVGCYDSHSAWKSPASFARNEVPKRVALLNLSPRTDVHQPGHHHHYQQQHEPLYSGSVRQRASQQAVTVPGQMSG